MQWWQWLIVVLGVLIVLTAAWYGIQLRRRRGGIIAQRGGGTGGSGSRGGAR